MKTIILTSAGMDIKDRILENLSKHANELKLAFITTASKVENDTSYVEKDRKELISSGFRIEEIDIEGKSEVELKSLLSDFDVIFVEGGNTFYLLKAIKESGFDKVIKELITKGVVYIGVSAGTMIAGPTIETATWKNVDNNTVGLKDLTALNLVPFNIYVHYSDEWKEIVEEESKRSKYQIITLTDNQGILVKDNEYVFLEK